MATIDGDPLLTNIPIGETIKKVDDDLFFINTYQEKLSA